MEPRKNVDEIFSWLVFGVLFPWLYVVQCVQKDR